MQLPVDFIHGMKGLLGESDYSLFFEALQQEPPVSIRLNTKFTSAQVNKYQSVSWCKNGYYLPSRPLFTADPLFHAGAYYVQEASSMFIEQIIKQHVQHDVIALDLCAAPGGKSTHLASLLSTNSLLVSNEFIRSRANILAENCMKWGNGNMIITSNSSDEIAQLESFFDFILVDAPCSGEGMFRKDVNAINEWSLLNVEMCVTRQRHILKQAWQALAEDGFLVYSTCTFNEKENEENIKWLIHELGAEYIPIAMDNFPEITNTDVGYRFYPHKTKGEGLFMALVQKKSACNKQNIKLKTDKNKQNTADIEALNLYINDSSDWIIQQNNQQYRAILASKQQEIKWIEKHLYVLFSGIQLAEKKGNDFVPHEHLALSKQLNTNSFQVVDVDWITAIQFLKREALFLPDASKGYVLLQYNNVPLGWVKNIGNRCNNMYPSSWKVRMDISHFTNIQII